LICTQIRHKLIILDRPICLQYENVRNLFLYNRLLKLNCITKKVWGLKWICIYIVHTVVQMLDFYARTKLLVLINHLYHTTRTLFKRMDFWMKLVVYCIKLKSRKRDLINVTLQFKPS